MDYAGQTGRDMLIFIKFFAFLTHFRTFRARRRIAVALAKAGIAQPDQHEQ
jgi:hypothetical protein